MNKYEQEILQCFFDYRRNASILEVSKETGFCWLTTKKYTMSLVERNWLLRNGNKFKFNYERLGLL